MVEYINIITCDCRVYVQYTSMCLVHPVWNILLSMIYSARDTCANQRVSLLDIVEGVAASSQPVQ